MAKLTQPSNLELQALSVLWREGPSTVSAVLESLPDGKDRAYTTVLTIMQNLERKNLVTRERVGRAHSYRAIHSQQTIIRQATKEYLINAFGGRLGEAILAILSTGNLTPEEKTTIERELQRHRTMAAKKKTARKRKATKKKVTKRKAPARKKKATKKKVTKKKVTKKKAAKRKVTKKKTARKKKVAKKAKKKTARKKKAVKKKATKKKATKKKAAKKKATKKKATKKRAKKKTASKKKAAKKK